MPRKRWQFGQGSGPLAAVNAFPFDHTTVHIGLVRGEYVVGPPPELAKNSPIAAPACSFATQNIQPPYMQPSVGASLGPHGARITP
jgi:hypothetical protein